MLGPLWHCSNNTSWTQRGCRSTPGLYRNELGCAWTAEHPRLTKISRYSADMLMHVRAFVHWKCSSTRVLKCLCHFFCWLGVFFFLRKDRQTALKQTNKRMWETLAPGEMHKGIRTLAILQTMAHSPGPIHRCRLTCKFNQGGGKNSTCMALGTGYQQFTVEI